MPKITNVSEQDYVGFDADFGEDITIPAGESREVSADKAAQLAADFPNRFEGPPKRKSAARGGQGKKRA